MAAGAEKPKISSLCIAFLRPRFGPLLFKIDADICEIKFGQYIGLQPRERIFCLSRLASEISMCKHKTPKSENIEIWQNGHNFLTNKHSDMKQTPS